MLHGQTDGTMLGGMKVEKRIVQVKEKILKCHIEKKVLYCFSESCFSAVRLESFS